MVVMVKVLSWVRWVVRAGLDGRGGGRDREHPWRLGAVHPVNATRDGNPATLVKTGVGRVGHVAALARVAWMDAGQGGRIGWRG